MNRFQHRPVGSARHRRPLDRSDRGTTLIEMVLAITLVGIVMGSVTAAAVVLFRNTGATTERVSAAQDVRQLVNYFPGDVRSTTWSGVEIHEAGSDIASSCSGVPAGSRTLHLGLTSADGRSRTEYRTTASAAEIALHRWTCIRDDPAESFGPGQRVRVGDGLRSVEPVTVTRHSDRIELEMHRTSGTSASLAATPFEAQDPIVIAAPNPEPSDPGAPGTAGPCPASPIPLTEGFSVMTAGDAVLQNHAGEFYGPIAVGGDLTFKNNTSSTQSGGTFVAPEATLPTALLVGGKVDWPDSGGGFLNIHHGYLHVGDLSNWGRATGGNPNQLVLTATSGAQNRQIRIHDTYQTVDMVERPGLLDFDSAFAGFREISSGLGSLPGGCPGVTEVQLRGQNGQGEWTGGNVWLHHEPGHATVLTMSMAEYSSIGNVNLANGSANPGQGTPFIITITDGGTVRMPSGETNISRNHVLHVLWNFPNAERVVTGGTFWGTILAPNAVVEQRSAIRGNIIAARLESHQGIVSLQSFEGVFPWL